MRVALCQRRVQLVNQLGADSDVADGGGNNRVCELSGSEYFQLEHFGISSLEVNNGVVLLNLCIYKIINLLVLFIYTFLFDSLFVLFFNQIGAS